LLAKLSIKESQEMLNSRKYLLILKLFVLCVTILSFFNCSKSTYKLSQITGERVAVSNDYGQDKEIQDFIEPYKLHIDKDLDSILSYNPVTLDKSKGKWQTNIGDWMAQVCYEHANDVFNKKYSKKIDICLLNHGGIRAVLPKGNVNSRNAFEIMPFENNLVVLALKSDEIRQLVAFIINDKKPHPIYGMELHIDEFNNLNNLKIGNEPIIEGSTYYVVTSDYLANGGDNMVFFQNPIKTFNLDYKIRNVLIDEFKLRDTLIIPKQQKIFQE